MLEVVGTVVGVRLAPNDRGDCTEGSRTEADSIFILGVIGAIVIGALLGITLVAWIVRALRVAAKTRDTAP